MKKINSRKIMLILFISIVIISISTISFATLPDMTPQYGTGASQIKNVAQIVLGIIQVIAVATASVMLVVLAMKYISAAPAEKAQIKGSMLPYVVGALLLFAGAGVLNIIKGFAADINDATGGSSSSTSTSQGTWT